jgi:DNA polymerase III epsilon subunit-like protein
MTSHWVGVFTASAIRIFRTTRIQEIAAKIESILVDSWVVGHNVRFDAGFIAMELQQAGCSKTPLGCLDTCQLASALWDFPNYKLETVVNGLGIPTTRLHRALDDASVTREIFHRVVQELGGWEALTVDDLLRLHRYEPLWPNDPKGDLPKPLYDALTNGRSLSIRYVNAEGQSSSRVIRPETSFASGRFTYIRAFCERSDEVRTFRLDRIVIDDEREPSTQE